MKRIGFDYIVQAEVEITKANLGLLLENSRRHYDGVCRAASQQGGFLYGYSNMMRFSEEEVITETPTGRELDLMCKVMEGDSSGRARMLAHQLRCTLQEVCAEYDRLKPREKHE